MSKTKLLTCLAAAILLISLSAGSFVFAASSNTSSTSFTLALAGNYIQYKIPVGTTFSGTITTSGMVRFWASDPNGTSVANLGIIDSKGTFSFVANKTGVYTFNFENDMPNTVQVTFTYTANPALPGGDSTAPSLIYWSVVAAIAVVGSLAIIIVIRRKAKLVNEAIDKAAGGKQSAASKRRR